MTTPASQPASRTVVRLVTAARGSGRISPGRGTRATLIFPRMRYRDRIGGGHTISRLILLLRLIPLRQRLATGARLTAGTESFTSVGMT